MCTCGLAGKKPVNSLKDVVMQGCAQLLKETREMRYKLEEVATKQAEELRALREVAESQERDAAKTRQDLAEIKLTLEELMKVRNIFQTIIPLTFDTDSRT